MEQTMNEQTFQGFIDQERQRLAKRREDILAERATFDQQLAAIDNELVAIQAYEDAKKGKPTTGTTRSRRGSKREAVLDVIKQHPAGIARADILDAMTAKGDKKAEQSISNALTNMKKANTIGQGADKLYRIS